MNSKNDSMLYPPIAELLEKADSKYTLCIMTAKRARQLTAGSIKRVETNSLKNVTVAINEIDEGKVTFTRTKDGIK